MLLACSPNEDSKIFHPTPENLKVGNVISAEEANLKDNNPVRTKLLSALEGVREISSIGELYGADEEMFGFIKDIVTDAFNRIYILDSDKQQIQVFTQKGDYITTLGRKGQGPGEFERARSMTNYKNELLLVSNGYRIEVYDIQNKEIKFLKSIQLHKWIRSICTIGDKLFVHNANVYDEAAKKAEAGSNFLNIIHAYAIPSFEPLYSFGQSYKSANPMVMDRMSSGDLSCNRSSATVLLAFERMPVLYGYSAENGQLKWKSRINGLHFADVIQTNKGERTRLTYRVPKSNMMDWIAPSVTFKDQYEVLQVHRRITPEGSYETEREVLTFFLNSSNGEASFLSKKIPAIVNISDNLMITVSDEYMTSKIYKFDLSKDIPQPVAK